MIPIRNTGLTLCLWREQRRYSREEIAAILTQCKSDPSAMMDLRAVLHQRAGMAGVETMDEDHMLEGIASLIYSGELLLFGTPAARLTRTAGGGGGESRRSSTAAGPPPRRTTTPRDVSAPAPDPPVFPPSADCAALVEVLKTAAESGVPLCDT